MNLHVTVI